MIFYAIRIGPFAIFEFRCIFFEPHEVLFVLFSINIVNIISIILKMLQYLSFFWDFEE